MEETLLFYRIKAIIKDLDPSSEAADVWFACNSQWNCGEYGETCIDCVTNRIIAEVEGRAGVK